MRQAAAVNFKNHVKFYWAPRDTEGSLDSLPIAVSDPEKVRCMLAGLMSGRVAINPVLACALPSGAVVAVAVG